MPVTPTVITQAPLLADSPTLPRETLPEPAVAVAVPPQSLFNRPWVETTSPLGKVSVKPTPETRFCALMTKVKVVLPFTGMVVGGLKVFSIVGAFVVGAFPTVTLALDVLPVP